MKHIIRRDTAELSPFSAKLTKVAQLNPVDPRLEFGWLASLPIAGAIFRLKDDRVEYVLSNPKFDDLALGFEREAGLDLGTLADRAFNMVENGRDTHFECWQSPDPVNKRELEISIARFGANGTMILLSMVDRTAEATSRLNLRREMLSDSLTGFCNRTGFEEEIEARIEALSDSGSDQAYAIILIDLARFSRINESAGAMVGDELIITVARRLNSRTRSNEILCRLGGNEFALFVQLGNDCSDVRRIADRLMDAFATPCQLSSLEIQVDCAAAAAIGTVGGDDPMDTLRHAQIALKKAKNSKAFELYTPGTVDTARRRFSMETDLRRALQMGELELHYQPLVDLDTGSLSGFEALARWHHPDLGAISPVDFIPVAEESGLIVPLGRWALEEAAKTIALWDSRLIGEQDFRISVNMSAVQIQRDNVVEAVAEALRGAKIPGNRLTLELTESAFINDPIGAKQLLDNLKALDTNLAMDDFGTGYSNLAYLQQLPIDVLKIDRSFVSEMMVNKDKRAIVRTVLSLARALGMKTTAEGIESSEISEVLRRLGCSVGQGYYFARPMTGEAAYAFLDADRSVPTS
ncbi:putative bifunctional diguanylate cyclase/phosphodiesterase [Sphingorhabdus sp.]|uniref:putative bifunctional diguanylate cyclase/phosphodiesterase n=1 Tax=Sphingorhabdus sp. TaxID=1902408 RepID=UPI0035938DAA